MAADHPHHDIGLQRPRRRRFQIGDFEKDLTRELIAKERKFIHALLRDGKIADERRRRIERDLDLEEASLSNREYRRMPL